MIVLMVLLFALFAVSLGIHVCLLSTGTHIGEKGHRNVILQNVFCIIEAVALISLGITWILSPNVDSGFWLFAIGLGLVLLLCSIVVTLKTMKESSSDLLTERLYEVRIVPAGFHNRDIQIRGMSDGNLRTFMIRGADKKMIKRIAKESDIMEITYHTSTCRIEAIKIVK